MVNQAKQAAAHTRLRTVLFKLKVAALIGLRSWRNRCSPIPRSPFGQQLIDAPVLAQSQSPLWYHSDTADNWMLTAGKIENLRIAARYLHGLEVPAQQLFSFWRQIGYPNWGRGFVLGRELREGCMVPSIAGGLCQLSNALYDAALKAGFDIVERHRHSQVVTGSLAEQNRDATVKWNYLDLRFKAHVPFRIEVILDATHLLLRFRAATSVSATTAPDVPDHPSAVLNDCYSCGNHRCSQHPSSLPTTPHRAQSCYLVDERWPEFEHYLQQQAQPNERLIRPLNHRRYAWHTAAQTRQAGWAAWYRAWAMRFARKQNVFQLALQLDQRLAAQSARLIPLTANHLVISQNLLPAVYASGALGGRSFDVLMTRLPMGVLQQQLDQAYQLNPASPTLNDFRADSALIQLEQQALQQARYLISPHAEIARLFPDKTRVLPWASPKLAALSAGGQKVLFPASALARKGAYLVKRLAQELSLSLVVAGQATEYPDFWQDLKIEAFNGQFSEIGLVVYPALIEHQPRLLLRAIGHGIPVVCSSACGITDGVILVPANDYNALRQVVQQQLARNAVAV